MVTGSPRCYPVNVEATLLQGCSQPMGCTQWGYVCPQIPAKYRTPPSGNFFLGGGLINLFIYLFLAVLGLRFCARAFSSCGKRGPLFITVRGPLTITASLVAEHRLQTRRLSSCGSRALLLCGMWDLPRPGLEPVSPALAGRLSTTAPPGKPHQATLTPYHPCQKFLRTALWADVLPT